MQKWKRVHTAEGPRFRSSFTPHEAAVLNNVMQSLLSMLDEREAAAPEDELEQITGIKTGHATPPQEATLRRLLPDFHRPDQPTAATESLNSALRSLHEPQIIAAKRGAARRLLRTVPAEGGRCELTEEDAHAWVAAVNDLRLALGTMLEIGPHGPDRLPGDHPLAGHLDVYQWLTFLQEYLVVTLMEKRA